MKVKTVIHTVGQILLIEAGLLLIPAVVGLIYHEQTSFRAFMITAVITAAAGLLIRLVKPGKSSIHSREGLGPFVDIAQLLRLSAFRDKQADPRVYRRIFRNSLRFYYDRRQYPYRYRSAG